MFYIAAAVYVLDTVVYLFFASSEEQSWNREETLPRVQSQSTEHLVPVPEEAQNHTVTSDEEAGPTDNANGHVRA